MKLPKLNQSGIAHLLAPIAFIGVFAVIGGIVILRSHAQTTSNNSHWLYGIVKYNGVRQYKAQVKSTAGGGTATAYTDKNGFYEFYETNYNLKFVMHASKVINGIKYCAKKTFQGYYDPQGMEADFKLSRSAC